MLLLALAVLQVGDFYTTTTILKNGGRELNPVMRKLFDLLGVELAMVIKGVGAVVMAYYVLPVEYLVPLVVLYCAVVAFNFRSMP